MKKQLLILFAFLLTSLSSVYARTVLIDEGFENGIQDSVWTQEFVSGNTPWAVEDIADSLAYPATVYQGTKRAYLRNNTNETQGYVTRLVSKVMNLHPLKVYMPELVFWYANPRWGGDRDTLRVLYRTGARAAWKQLAEYSTASANWQKVKLSLPEVGTTYQIAFEGSDNLGHGIVLDSIKLQSAPDCTIPYDISAINKGAGKVNVAWRASYDADYFDLIVCKDTIDPDTVANVDPSRVAFHGQVTNATNHDVSVEPGEFYLVYVRSVCEDEISAWSSETSHDGPFGFKVRTTKQVPFTETFNYQYGVYQDPDWSYGNSTGKLNPFVNSKATTTAWAYYSPDTTASLIFSGGETSKPSALIPADNYVYMATPALSDTTRDDFQVNQCQVHFWSTVYTFTGRQYGRSIIVGVMTSPDDITTFEPVDTVTVWGNMTFQENIVDLSSYTGTGAYVAFVSAFDRQNVFYIDNLTIEYRPQVNKVTKISVNPRDTYATISWEGNAPLYNVLVTNAEVNPNNPDPDAIIEQTTVSDNSYVCDQLEPNHSWNQPYYVYVQAQGTDWSYRYPFVTIAPKREIPYTFDFEGVTKYQIPGTTGQFVQGLGIFGNSGTYPAVVTDSRYSYAGLSYLFMSKRGGADSWITLPMVDDLDSVQVKFYLSGSTTYAQSHATIGIMTNPMDINTFIPVSHFMLNTNGYTRCYANFVNYSGPEGVIAIVWDDVMKMSQNTINYIDEIIVEELSDCVPPTNIELEVEPDSITVRWEVSTWDQWEFFLSRTPLRESDRVHKTLEQIASMGGVVIADSLEWSDPNTMPQFGFGNLVPHANYYLYVRATCDREWWSEATFSTPCKDELFPYKEAFENYNIGSTSAGCWQLADYMGVDYPSIYQVGTTSASNKALELYSSGTIHRSVAILPKVEGELSDMLLTFDVRTLSTTSSTKGVVFVGTMEDIDDANTFVPFDTVFLEGSTSFKKVRFILSNYQLEHSNLAISSGLGTLLMSSDILIDNVELKDPSCIDAYDFKQTDFAPHSVDISWSGVSDNDLWQLKVLSANVSLNAIKNNSYNTNYEVVGDTLVIGKNFHVAGLQSQRAYYIYVRTLCGDSTWNVVPVQTTCEFLNPTKANKETFESYSAGEGSVPDCWTVGTRTGTGTNPYVYSLSTPSTKVLHIRQSSTTSPAWAASPEIECDSLKSILVTFDVSTYNNEWMVFGVMTDPTDLSTFVPLDSLSGTGSSNVMPKSYDLSDYAAQIPASAKFVAWRGRYGTGDWVYLDNVSFISMACPMTKPSISELTTQSVRVSSGLRTSDQWILMLTNTAISDANLAKDDYIVPDSIIVYRDTLNSRSKEIFGLEGQTKYYVYTAALCDSVTMSQWSTINFMTPCVQMTPEELGTVTFDEKEGFEVKKGGETPCWTTGSKTDDAPDDYKPYVANETGYMHNNNNYLLLRDNVTTSSSYIGAYAVMPALDVDSITKYQVNFWGRGNSSATANSQVIVGIVTDPSDLNTFVAIDTLNLSKSTWDPFSVGFEKYDGDYLGDWGTNIMFLSEFGESNYAYISEVSVELIPRCRAVTSFSVDSVGEAEAIVSWKGYQDSYRLLIADKVLTEAQKPLYHYLLDSIVTESENVLIRGLQPTSNYYVYAQGICDDGDSTAISMVYANIRTTCPLEAGIPVPFYDDFESYDVNEKQPGCWQMLWTSSRPSFFEVREVSGKGTKAIDVWSTSSNGCYMGLPKVDADLADLKLSFDARQYSGSSEVQMYVGVMADVNDPTTFVQLDSCRIAKSTDFTHCELELSAYELPYDNLVITAGLPGVTYKTYDVWLDNVALERSASCSAPRLKLISTSFDAAEVTLNPALKTDSLWEVVVLPDSVYSIVGNMALYLESAPSMLLDSTHLVLSNLESATSYYIYARTICSLTDKSAWTRSPLKFSTRFYFAEDYEFGFEKKTELWENSKYSASENYYLHPALITGRDSLGTEDHSFQYYPYSRENNDSVLYSYIKTGTGALVMHAYKTFHGGYVIFPAIDQASARSFEFKARPGDIKVQDNYPKSTSDAMLEIGLIDKDRNFDTYQYLATIHLEKLNVNTKATTKNAYHYKNYTLDFDSVTMATKQVVLHMPKQKSDSVNIYIDDVKLKTSKGYSLVSLTKVIPSGSGAMVEWANIGGPWKLTIKNASGTTVAQYDNLSDTTSQWVEGLTPQTDYTAVLEARSVPVAANSYVTSDKLAFRTLCLPLDPNADNEFVWNFDSEWEDNDVQTGLQIDSLYLKPACFQTGITYDEPVNGYQWLIQRKGYEAVGPMTGYNASRHQEVGRNDSHALRVHTTDANYNAYIILPELNCNFDTMMLEFYARCFTNYDQTYSSASFRGKIVDATYLGAAYSQSMVVGTLSDPTDFSTLHIIDTLKYSNTDLTATDNVNDDPDNLRYWELMRLPLDEAQGKFIVLFQPAPGLFYIDDMAVKPVGNTMFKPTNMTVTDITANSATLGWNVRQPQFGSVVVITNTSGEEIQRDTVLATSYNVTNLDPAMRYGWYVYQTDGLNASSATKPMYFATECVTITSAYTCSFEPEQGWKNIEGQSNNYKQTLCWTYGDALHDSWTSATFDPYNQANTHDFKYSHSGESALMLRASYSARGTSYQPYAAMPAMDITTYDTLQVKFRMRPAYVSASNDSVISSYTGSTYSKSIIVGTMADPSAPATFVPLDTITYDGTLSVADAATEANDYLFQEVKVELAGATGPYVAFMTSSLEKGGTAQKSGDYLWIDDVAFEHRQECKEPTELKALQIGTYHAVLTWNGIDSAGTYLLQVSTDPFFAKEDNFVFNGEVNTNTYRVTGMSPLTTYVWRVQAQCGEKWGESNFSQKATFKTSRSPYFLEPFATTVNSNDWTFSKAHAENVIDTTGTITRGTDNWSFARTTTSYGLQGPHYVAPGYSGDYHWMITPNFYLPEEDSVHLSFDLALTACNTAHLPTGNAVTENDMKNDYYFMVIISDDGGETWKSENIIAKWQNTNPEGMQLRDIPTFGKNVRFSLAAYAGKNVRIGLYREAKTTSTTGIAIHVDNIRLAYFDKTIEGAFSCEYEDVHVGDIYLSGDETTAGIHAYPTCYFATDEEARAGKRDSVYSLEIEVFPSQNLVIEDTICEGDKFTDFDFQAKDKTGVYRRKLQTVEHGCDSIVTLYLEVKERRYGEDTETAICLGESIEWHGNLYNRAGIYRDTTVSSIGCDSIETLVISYVSSIADTIYDSTRVDISELPFTYTNPEHPYFGDQLPIYYAVGTPTGTYVDAVLVEGETCSTVLIHTLVIYDRLESIDAILDDENQGALKILYGGNMYIVIHGEWFNAAGQKVADPRIPMQ